MWQQVPVGIQSLQKSMGGSCGSNRRGETARACAARELHEEACQVAQGLHFECLVELLRPTGERKFTAVYSTSLREIAEFRENPEWVRIMLWDFSGFMGDIDAVDLAILRCVADSRGG
jgi:hypothetical protein